MVLAEDVGIGADGFDGFVAVGFVNAHGAPGADSVGVEENHNVADEALFVPGLANLAAAHWSDAVDLFQQFGSVFDDVDDLLAEVFEQFLGVGGADAFD